MIGNLPPQLAGAAGLKIFQPTWMPAALDQEDPVEQPPGYLLRARAAATAHPYNPVAHARLAQAAQAGGQVEEAIQAARRALDLGLDERDPSSVHAAVVVLEAHESGSELAPLLDDQRNGWLPMNLRLRAAIAAGEHAAAISILSDPQAADQVSPDALSLLTWVHLQRGEFQQAVAAGRRAQAAGATGVTLYANLGYAHAALGQLSKAIKWTRQAQALAPLHRGVGLNLALYLKLAGDHDGALSLLEQLRVGERTDIQLALAMANVEVYAGDAERARRLLQRVRASSEWALAGTARRAELEANLALLRWKTGAANAHTTITSMRRALSTTDYESLSIAYLLANLLLQSEHAPLLAGVIDRLQTRHAPAELEGLRMVLALLEQDAAGAVDFAMKWAQREVLNPSAAAFATYLVSDLDGDYAQAAQIGLRGLSRAPGHMMLINNTAYSLALAGCPERANKLLRRLDPSCDCVEVVATRALADLLMGRTERGLEGYRRAWDLAISVGDEQLADRVAANALLGRVHAGLGVPEAGFAVVDRLAKAAETRPGSWIVSQRLQRELPIRSPTGNEHSGSDTKRSIAEEATHIYRLNLDPPDSAGQPRCLPPSSNP
jgi:Flp pilus assembly protein TadD